MEDPPDDDFTDTHHALSQYVIGYREGSLQRSVLRNYLKKSEEGSKIRAKQEEEKRMSQRTVGQRLQNKSDQQIAEVALPGILY